MIDILDLNEKSKEWVSDGLEFLTSHLTYGNALELTDRLIAAEKDAARYRWLRECTTEQSEMMVDNGHVVGFGVLDALIDEAMSVNQA